MGRRAEPRAFVSGAPATTGLAGYARAKSEPAAPPDLLRKFPASFRGEFPPRAEQV